MLPLQSLEGGRRKGVVMIPEGRRGAGRKELAALFQEVVSHLSQLKHGRGYSYGVGVRKEVSFVEVVKKGALGETVDGSVLAVEGDGAAGGGVKRTYELPASSHAKKEDVDSFSKSLAFNAKSAGREMIDVSCWRKKLMGFREEVDTLLNLLGLESGPGHVKPIWGGRLSPPRSKGIRRLGCVLFA